MLLLEKHESIPLLIEREFREPALAALLRCSSEKLAGI
jgi:hypothetical protein